MTVQATSTSSETRTCTICGQTKPVGDYQMVLGQLKKHCKACHALYRQNAVQINETRTYGVEIEFYASQTNYDVAAALTAAGVETHVEYYGHSTPTTWKIVTDASLNNRPAGMQGWELVSPPLKGKAGLKAVKTAAQVLTRLGCKVNRTCGLHVHHDARDLDLASWKRLLTTYVRFEHELDTYQPASRRASNNGMCNTLVRWSGVDGTIASINAAARRTSLVSFWGTRYTKVNTQAFTRHGTIEFRQHAGTIDADKITNWIQLTQLSMTAAKQARPVGATYLQTVGAKAKLARYFAARATTLAAA